MMHGMNAFCASPPSAAKNHQDRKAEKIKTWLLAPVCVFALLVNSSCKCSPDLEKGNSYSSEWLQAVVSEYLNGKNNLLGTIVRVDVGGKDAFAAAEGFFDLSRKTLLDPRSKFIIASITKLFTAVLVLQLEEKGKVQLHDPLIHYLPPDWTAILGGIKHGGEISVEHALRHRSGLGDSTESDEFWQDLIREPAKKRTALEVLEFVRQKGEPKFKPGTGFDYNNANYLLLGALIEHVTRKSYAMSLRENILNRIGLNNTFLSAGTFGSSRPGIAHGYFRMEDKVYDGQEVNVGWAQAAGGIISNAEDLITFYRALASGKLFERKESYEKMCRLAGGNESYGLGLMVVDDPEIGLYCGHEGSFCNTRSLLAHFPKQQITMVVCHTDADNALLEPGGLMKAVMKSMMNDEQEEAPASAGEVNDILADRGDVVENSDVPARGSWDFAPKEVWSISRLDARPLAKTVHVHVGRAGEIFLLDRESAEISVLDRKGNLLFSFGGEGEGAQLEYPSELYVTPDRINVLDLGNRGGKIKMFDKKGNWQNSFKLEAEISPRIFISGDQYVAVRSGSDIDNRQAYEKIELLSLKRKGGTVMGKIAAEGKLIVSANVLRGRVHVMMDDIEIFPRLIIHLDQNKLFLGKSDRYLIKKTDLRGKGELAFAIKGRKRKSLPPHYAEGRVAGIGLVGGREMPREMKEQLLAGIPDQQVFFTKIATDEQGLVYVFAPDIGNSGKKEIDIFSPEGKYLYHAVIEFPAGLQGLGPLAFQGEHLYVLLKAENEEIRLAKYSIRKPGL